MRLHSYLVLAALILIDLKYSVISESYVVSVRGTFFKSTVDLSEEIVYPLASVEYILDAFDKAYTDHAWASDNSGVFLKLAAMKRSKLISTKEVSIDRVYNNTY